MFDRYSNSFLKIYFPIPAGREDEIARKVLITHLTTGNSYGIQLKEKHTKFPQPELGPWVEGSRTVRDRLPRARARRLGEAGRPLGEGPGGTRPLQSARDNVFVGAAFQAARRSTLRVPVGSSHASDRGPGDVAPPG